MIEPVPFKYCMHCGYCLRGLAKPRCPECGRTFDPDDPLTYASEYLAWYEEHAPLLGFFIATVFDIGYMLLFTRLTGLSPCLGAALIPLFGWLAGYQVLSRAHDRNRKRAMGMGETRDED